MIARAQPLASCHSCPSCDYRSTRLSGAGFLKSMKTAGPPAERFLHVTGVKSEQPPSASHSSIACLPYNHPHVEPTRARDPDDCTRGSGMPLGNRVLLWQDRPVRNAGADHGFVMLPVSLALSISGFDLGSSAIRWQRMGLGFRSVRCRCTGKYLVQFEGLSFTTVSHASLMVGTPPMLLAIAAMLFSGERLHFAGWLALASATFGAALIALSRERVPARTSPCAATRWSCFRCLQLLPGS